MEAVPAVGLRLTNVYSGPDSRCRILFWSLSFLFPSLTLDQKARFSDFSTGSDSQVLLHLSLFRPHFIPNAFFPQRGDSSSLVFSFCSTPLSGGDCASFVGRFQSNQFSLPRAPLLALTRRVKTNGDSSLFWGAPGPLGGGVERPRLGPISVCRLLLQDLFRLVLSDGIFR